jgi:hypothetical protein
MARLFAFQVAQELPIVQETGHYDADRQQWVGDGISRAVINPDRLTRPRPYYSGSLWVPYPPPGVDMPRIDGLLPDSQ